MVIKTATNKLANAKINQLRNMNALMISGIIDFLRWWPHQVLHHVCK